MTVTEKDHGFARIAAALGELSGPAAPWAAVGVQGDEALSVHGGAAIEDQGVEPTTVDLAIIHEFGVDTPNVTIPARSFLREALVEFRGEIEHFKRDMATAILRGQISPTKAVGLIGEYVLGIVKARISARIDPPLKQSTIDKKGSSVPLIETGQLRAGNTSEIRRGGLV